MQNPDRPPQALGLSREKPGGLYLWSFRQGPQRQLLRGLTRLRSSRLRPPRLQTKGDQDAMALEKSGQEAGRPAGGGPSLGSLARAGQVMGKGEWTGRRGCVAGEVGCFAAGDLRPTALRPVTGALSPDTVQSNVEATPTQCPGRVTRLVSCRSHNEKRPLGGRSEPQTACGPGGHHPSPPPQEVQLVLATAWKQPGWGCVWSWRVTLTCGVCRWVPPWPG